MTYEHRKHRLNEGNDDDVAHRGGEALGMDAASAAAFARPCKASIGALRAERGSVSSDSSSEEGAVLGTMPYVAYL